MKKSANDIKEIAKSYNPPETHIVINANDYDLVPVTIKLPPPPKIELITGYGLEPHEQKFQREVYPDQLKSLEKKLKKEIKEKYKREAVIEDIWLYLFNNQYEYRDTIKWLKKQWYKRFNGDWQFINGTPTYIPLDHWYYVNYWHNIQGKNEYRDSQRRRYIAWEYFENCTKDYTGKEWGRKLFVGVNEMKPRRQGVTGQASCKGINKLTREYDKKGTIQTINKDKAVELFNEHYMLYGFLKLPFFFKPFYYMSDGIHWAKKSSAGQNKIDEDMGLCSEFTTNPATVNALQGGQLAFLHNDEIANTDEYDIYQRFEQQRQTLVLGDKIIGFCLNTSNVENSSSQGGKNFEQLCMDSMINKINQNGMTETGLANFFNPACEGLEGFIDEYGASIINTPTERQKKFTKKNYGALEFINNQRILLEKQEKWDKLAAFKRKYPLTFRECFAAVGTGIGFNMNKISERKIDISFNGDDRVRGNLRWFDNIKDGEVEFIPDADGRCIMTELPTIEKRNLKYSLNGVFYPCYPDIWSAGADPYKLNVATRGSLGGGAVFKCRDFNRDKDDLDVNLWTSNNFVFTYQFRPETRDEYCEDMLMMCVLYGALMYPENNIEFIEEHFIKRGYKGFLNYDIDPRTGYLKTKAGDSTLSNSQLVFDRMVNYINTHAGHEKHIEIFEECELIKGTEDMKKHDLFVACSYAMKGAENKYKRKKKEEIKSIRKPNVHLFPVNRF